MLLKGYKITVGMCLADPEKIRIVAELTDDIGDVLPYLNATFRGCMYNHNGQVLTLKKDGRQITFRPQEIAITKLENENKAIEILDWLKGLINMTYDNRESTKPKLESWLILTPLSLSISLPGEKCKDCSGKDCYGFAQKLIVGEVNIMQCKPLFTCELIEKKKKVLGLLEQAGYSVPVEFL
ncbi:MAG: (Fe-S)-binding protein [Thermodesulfobacteriota bacterium]